MIYPYRNITNNEIRYNNDNAGHVETVRVKPENTERLTVTNLLLALPTALSSTPNSSASNLY